MNTEKIVLGTVQFGLNYGINNSLGRPDLTKVQEILNLASNNGINELDTADAYGEAAEVLKTCLGENSVKFKIMSKCTIERSEDFSKAFHGSLKRLGQKQLEGYYFHRFSDYKNFHHFDQIEKLKAEGLLKYLAVSLYELDELKIAAVDPSVDVIQIPLNVLDCSDEKKKLLELAKNNNKLIYIRSAFLQGLFFKKPSELPAQLKPLGPALETIQRLALKYEMKIEQLCLNFCLHLPFVDKVIIGVDSADQLQSNLELLLPEFSREIVEDIYQIKVIEPKLLNPASWLK